MAETVIIAGFFPPPITGQGLATQRLGELLQPHFDVHCVNLRTGEEQLDLRMRGRILHKVRQYRSAGARLKKLLIQFPEATVFWTAISPQRFGHYRDLITILPAFGPGHKVYAVIHWGKFAHLFKARTTSLTARSMSKKLHGLVFLNQDRSNQCAPWIADNKRFVIPNTLDSQVLCTEQEIEAKFTESNHRDTVNILFLSNMIREKGYLDVLHAVQLLRKEGAPVKATFAGQWLSTEDEHAFYHYVQSNGLQHVVTHNGQITERAQIKALHMASDVFILPSYLIEGQPLTIIEAMNAASPIITTRIGGMVDMISEGKEGFFVPHQSPSSIAAATRRLLDPSTRRKMAKAARKRYLKAYSAEYVTQLWRQLVESEVQRQ